MDQRRLLPGEPSSSEGSTVGPRVLSQLPRPDLTNLDTNLSQIPNFQGNIKRTNTIKHAIHTKTK